MSRESYIKGFCKAASDRNVDPQRLAQYALTKSAGSDTLPSSSDIWGSLRQWLDQAKTWYGKQDAGTKALIGAGSGALLGGALGGIVGGGRGLAAGGLVGGLSGAAMLADWNKLLGKEKKDLSPEEIQAIYEAGRQFANRK